MRRTLDNVQMAIVEAVYICVIKKSLPKDIQNPLIGILRKNAYMFIYFGWLLHRWYPLYSKYDDHLLRKYTDQASRSSRAVATPTPPRQKTNRRRQAPNPTLSRQNPTPPSTKPDAATCKTDAAKHQARLNPGSARLGFPTRIRIRGNPSKIFN